MVKRRFKNKAAWKQAISRALTKKKRRKESTESKRARLNTMYRYAGDFATGAAGVGVVAGLGTAIVNPTFRRKVGTGLNKTIAEPIGRVVGYAGAGYERGKIEGGLLYGQQVKEEVQGVFNKTKKNYQKEGGPGVKEIPNLFKRKAQKDIKLLTEGTKKVFSEKAQKDSAARKRIVAKLNVPARIANSYSLGRNVTTSDELSNPAYNSGSVAREVGRAVKDPRRKVKNDVQIVKRWLGFNQSATNDFWLKFEQRKPELILFSRKGRPHSAKTKAKISRSLRERNQNGSNLANLEKGTKIATNVVLSGLKANNIRLAGKKLRQDLTSGEARRWITTASSASNAGAAWGRVFNTGKQNAFTRRFAITSLKARKPFYNGIRINAAVRAASAKARGIL